MKKLFRIIGIAIIIMILGIACMFGYLYFTLPGGSYSSGRDYSYDHRIFMMDVDTISELNKGVCKQIVRFAHKVSKGEMTETILHLDLNELLGKTRFTAEELGASQITEENMSDYADQVLDYKIRTFIEPMLWDYPYEFFWFDKCAGFDTEPIKLNCEDNSLVLPDEIIIRMAVVDDYKGKEPNTVSKKQIKRANKAIDHALEIVDEAKNLTDYEKLAYYRDKICSLTDYCRDLKGRDIYSGGYGDPWQMVYVFDQDPDTTVLCEGYAKAFQFLCDNTQFDGNVWCFTVRGKKNGGKHCWNIVHMDDGNFYMADITTSDNRSHEGDRVYFLQGTDSGSVRRGFTFKEMQVKNENGNYTVPKAKFTYYDEMIEVWSYEMLNISKKDYIQ